MSLESHPKSPCVLHVSFTLHCLPCGCAAVPMSRCRCPRCGWWLRVPPSWLGLAEHADVVRM